MASKVGRWLPTVVALVLCAAVAAWGGVLAAHAPEARALTGTRTVPVREATLAAGDPAPVRLQGTLVAMPALVAPDGREYALQRLTIARPGDAPAGDAPGDDAPGDDAPGDDAPAGAYGRLLPSQVFLSDGDSVVAVEPADVDPSFLPLVVAGTTLDDGRPPPEVATHVATAFADLPRRPGARVTLRGIRTGEPVAAYGTLVLREGVPSLVRPVNGDPFVLTTMSFPEVERSLRSRERLGRLAGWALVGLGALGALIVLLRPWRPARRRPT